MCSAPQSAGLTGFKEDLSQLRSDLEREQNSRKELAFGSSE